MKGLNLMLACSMVGASWMATAASNSDRWDDATLGCSLKLEEDEDDKPYKMNPVPAAVFQCREAPNSPYEISVRMRFYNAIKNQDYYVFVAAQETKSKLDDIFLNGESFSACSEVKQNLLYTGSDPELSEWDLGSFMSSIILPRDPDAEGRGLVAPFTKQKFDAIYRVNLVSSRPVDSKKWWKDFPIKCQKVDPL